MPRYLIGQTPAQAFALNLPYDQAALQRYATTVGLDMQARQMEEQNQRAIYTALAQQAALDRQNQLDMMKMNMANQQFQAQMGQQAEGEQWRRDLATRQQALAEREPSRMDLLKEQEKMGMSLEEKRHEFSLDELNKKMELQDKFLKQAAKDKAADAMDISDASVYRATQGLADVSNFLDRSLAKLTVAKDISEKIKALKQYDWGIDWLDSDEKPTGKLTSSIKAIFPDVKDDDMKDADTLVAFINRVMPQVEDDYKRAAAQRSAEDKDKQGLNKFVVKDPISMQWKSIFYPNNPNNPYIPELKKLAGMDTGEPVAAGESKEVPEYAQPAVKIYENDAEAEAARLSGRIPIGTTYWIKKPGGGAKVYTMAPSKPKSTPGSKL